MRRYGQLTSRPGVSERFEAGPLLGNRAQQIEEIAGRPRQTIKPGNDKHIAFYEDRYASKIAGNTVATIPIATEEEDRKWTEDFKTSWAGTPYPPIFVTADAVMIRDQQVLLVLRGRLPGRGRLALPGGYVDQDELIRDAAIRELIEETNPSDGSQLYSPKMLYDWITAWQVFDDPRRSARGRVITTAFVFEVPKDAPEISFTAGDDAGEAAWQDLNNLNPAEFFEDHFHIIRELLF